MNATPLVWLAAEYHLPATYSCRLPFSSPQSALVSPAPGPATVRLALVRSGLELFDRDVVRDSLFPWLRGAPVLIRPPERVALSEQVLRAYKADAEHGNVTFGESVVYRQMAHARGVMTVYLQVPVPQRETWEALLRNIGYWGQASPFGPSVRKICSAPTSAVFTASSWMAAWHGRRWFHSIARTGGAGAPHSKWRCTRGRCRR